MKITKLHITNFKSIKELELINPNPFSVFVGPNGAGKSNIFEALEFAVLCVKLDIEVAPKLFGGANSLLNYQSDNFNQRFLLDTNSDISVFDLSLKYPEGSGNTKYMEGISSLPFNIGSAMKTATLKPEIEQGIKRFSRLFIDKGIIRLNTNDDSVLNSNASNTEKVLLRILEDKNTKEEIIEWLQVLVPEFQDIEIKKADFSDKVGYQIYEKYSKRPFNKDLISDGTKNLVALLIAVYQSDKPQFLCIEEPENGLHPYVIESLVNLFRTACKEKGHYIWLNTHSQTLVRQLTVDEIIVVDKKEGATRTRQFQGRNLYGLKMDEAWLTNALGGGLP